MGGGGGGVEGYHRGARSSVKMGQLRWGGGRRGGGG